MTTEATQSLTVRLGETTIRKAKRLAAEQGSSVSRLVAELIDRLIGDDEAYEAAQRQALAEMAKGYRLGGQITSTRDVWHER